MNQIKWNQAANIPAGLKTSRLKIFPLSAVRTPRWGEMYRELTGKGVNIPNGFAITSGAYWYVIESAGILDELKDAMAGQDKTNLDDLMKRGKRARDLILSAGIPDDLWTEIRAGYDKLCEEYGPEDADVAVRSSATAEDLPPASFAGRRETYLNIRGYPAWTRTSARRNMGPCPGRTLWVLPRSPPRRIAPMKCPLTSNVWACPSSWAAFTQPCVLMRSWSVRTPSSRGRRRASGLKSWRTHEMAD